MRADHCIPGARVRVTGGPLKGKEGTVRTLPPLTAEFNPWFKKASVEIDGRIELVIPRWMEAA